jgi:hypothetical protein
LAVGAGTLVATLVLGSPSLYVRWRYRLTNVSREEDLPWDELLRLLEKRNRDRAAAGLPSQEPSEQELDGMLVRLPSVAAPRPLELPEDHAFQTSGNEDRRAGRRRWGNPTEVYIRELVLGDADSLSESLLDGLASLTAEPMHGIVVNRSTGGLGVYVDTEIAAGSFVTIRSVHSPSYIPAAMAEVRHCARAARGYIIGCEFSQDVPWQVRVWFG